MQCFFTLSMLWKSASVSVVLSRALRVVSFMTTTLPPPNPECRYDLPLRMMVVVGDLCFPDIPHLS